MRLVRLALNGWLANAGSPPPAELRLVGARAAGLRNDGSPIGPHEPHRLAFLLPDAASPEMETPGVAWSRANRAITDAVIALGTGDIEVRSLRVSTLLDGAGDPATLAARTAKGLVLCRHVAEGGAA